MLHFLRMRLIHGFSPGAPKKNSKGATRQILGFVFLGGFCYWAGGWKTGLREQNPDNMGGFSTPGAFFFRRSA